MAKKSFILIPGLALKDAREKKGYDQMTLGDIIGKSRQTINTWEGKSIVRVDAADAQKLTKALGVDLTGDKTISRETSSQPNQGYVPEHVLTHYRNTAEHIMNENKELWGLVKELRAERRGSKQAQ